jgi:hypothetical protein
VRLECVIFSVELKDDMSVGERVAQWPATAKLRQQYAAYLVNELAEDIPGGAIQLADYFQAGLVAEQHDGYVSFGNTGILCTEQYSPPETVYASSLVDLTLECLLLQFHGIFVSSFVYSRCVSSSSSNRPFWLDCFRRVSWVVTPSPLFVPIFAVMRHDLQQFAFRARQNMALALQSNQKVDHALELLIGGSLAPRKPWKIEFGSSVSNVICQAMTNAQITAKEVVPSSKAEHVDLEIEGDSAVCIRMAERDRLLLALLLLYATSNGAMGTDHSPWIHNLPTSAPESFHACKHTYPELWPTKSVFTK